MKPSLLERWLNHSRIVGRLLTLAGLLLRLPLRFLRRPVAAPRTILVLHHLLLGDTIMLAGLLAKLRRQYPYAAIHMATPTATVALFAGRPYGVEAHPFNPRQASTLLDLFRLDRPDLAIIPAENRYSLLATALGARRIVAFEGDRPPWKNWLVDELRPYPTTPMAWPDMATLLVDGPPPPAFSTKDWPQPAFRPYARPTGRYCVLHLGASSPLRLWSSSRWKEIADWLHAQGYGIVWSGGPREERLVEDCDPVADYPSLAGQLDLCQLWDLLANAALIVSPDTGVAHLAKACGTPSVTLFGPGSAEIYGPGEFWKNHPYRFVSIPDFPCRDGRMLFERTFVSWVRHCAKPQSECPSARCMHALTTDMVRSAISALLPH